MDFLHTSLAFVFTLGLLIYVHEYGHFWVARRCGVKVLRFSLGFGPVLFSRHDKQGTEFVLSAFPLGGYVKMLDEREGEVPADLLGQTFNRKSVWQRIAIVAAGPVVNLLFAVLIYWVMFLSGVSAVIPRVGDVQANSPAALAGLQSGQEIVAIDGNETQSWEAVTFALLKRIGDSGEMVFDVRSDDSTLPQKKFVVINDWMLDSMQQDPVMLLGIHPYVPVLAPILGELIEQGAAQRAGLQKGDRILAVDGAEVSSWSAWVALVQASPGKTLVLDVVRQDRTLQIQVTPD
ncbi:MAG TPA: RIP metalloprotease RseP, partial [Pseudomonadales bacterium]|nr:RIP metalloprotease RseP [Pseudomonadales bacterium]